MANKSTKDKNWFARHKVWTVILALIGIGVISSALGGGSSNSNSSKSGSSSNSSNKEYRFTDRADKQSTDVEVTVGEAASVDGVKMTVVSADRKNQLSDFEKAADGKQYLVVNVQLENTSDKTQAFNPFDFKIQTAGGQVLDSGLNTTGNALQSGDLVAGGKTSGSIVLEVPVESGHQYLIWKPNAFKSDRAVVQVQ